MVRSASLEALSISSTKLCPGLKSQALEDRGVFCPLKLPGYPHSPVFVGAVVADEEVFH